MFDISGKEEQEDGEGSAHLKSRFQSQFKNQICIPGESFGIVERDTRRTSCLVSSDHEAPEGKASAKIFHRQVSRKILRARTRLQFEEVSARLTADMREM